MKFLYLYRFKPPEGFEITKKLGEMLSKGNEVKEFKLYEENPDYDKLIEMIWEADKVVSWW